MIGGKMDRNNREAIVLTREPVKGDTLSHGQKVVPCGTFTHEGRAEAKATELVKQGHRVYLRRVKVSELALDSEAAMTERAVSASSRGRD